MERKAESKHVSPDEAKWVTPLRARFDKYFVPTRPDPDELFQYNGDRFFQRVLLPALKRMRDLKMMTPRNQMLPFLMADVHVDIVLEFLVDDLNTESAKQSADRIHKRMASLTYPMTETLSHETNTHEVIAETARGQIEALYQLYIELTE